MCVHVHVAVLCSDYFDVFFYSNYQAKWEEHRQVSVYKVSIVITVIASDMLLQEHIIHYSSWLLQYNIMFT